MIGPSAGCLPDALFARGGTLLGGSWIHDSEGYLRALRRGEALSGIAGKSALAPEGYPGFEARDSKRCSRVLAVETKGPTG